LYVICNIVWPFHLEIVDVKLKVAADHFQSFETCKNILCLMCVRYFPSKWHVAQRVKVSFLLQRHKLWKSFEKFKFRIYKKQNSPELQPAVKCYALICGRTRIRTICDF